MAPDPTITDVDPLLTANIYCSRRLDELVKGAIVPFWAGIDAEAKAAGCRLWLMRYAKRGEHLKVRIHGPEAFKEHLKTSLEAAVARHFDASKDDIGEWVSNPGVPPIDVEDQPAEDHEDRTLLFTTYQRSPVCFGEPTFCADERHVGLYCQAMAAQTELLLDRSAPYAGHPDFSQRRQNLLIQQVIAALAAIDFDDAEIRAYLRHHRGWLTRSMVARGDARTTSEQSVAAFFGNKIQRMGRAVEGLAQLFANREQLLASADPHMARWRETVGAYFDHVKTYRGDPRYDFDPYTDDHAFLPLYKILHIGSNQLGFRISGEAFVYYLLAAAARADEEQPDDSAQG
ncbi:MAG: lantibiotic dehydratase C-terminal domain-containing protein [Acidobacteriota bacterium]